MLVESDVLNDVSTLSNWFVVSDRYISYQMYQIWQNIDAKPVFLSGEWFTLLLNLPLIAYHVHRSLTSSPPPSWSWSPSPPPPPPSSPPSSCFAGIWNGLSCLAPAFTTRPISWTPTLFPGWLHCVKIGNESVVSFYFDSPLFPDARRRAGESWPFIWSPSSIISMGKSCHCIIIIKSDHIWDIKPQ